MDNLQKIKARCWVDKATGCWIWKSAIINGWSSDRRPTLNWKAYKCTAVTRIAWEEYNKQAFPTDLVAGHLCEGISPNSCHCVNPEHIEPMTVSKNNSMKRHTRSFPKGPTLKIPSNYSEAEAVELILKTYTVEVDSNYSSKCLEPKHTTHGEYWRKSWTRKGVRKTYAVHRLVAASYSNVLYKDVPSTTVTRHLCHNKKCINPEHLQLGTPTENNIDSRELTSSVTAQQVRELLIRWKEVGRELTYTQFWELEGKKLNLSYRGCRAILIGERWSDIHSEIFPEGIKTKTEINNENYKKLLEEYRRAAEAGAWKYGNKGVLKKEWAEKFNISIETVSRVIKPGNKRN